MDKFEAFLARDDIWFKSTVVAAFMVFFAISISVITALFGLPVEHLSDRVEVIYRLGLLGAGLVTFGSVVWRGLISARQADYQQRQIENLARQVAATEENNLALLLQKGAELLADHSKKAHLAAGIATLQAVITAENKKFVREAMELIADLIDEKFQDNNNAPLFRAAVEAIEAGFARGFKAARVVDFEASAKTKGTWRTFLGVERLNYRDGQFFRYIDDDRTLKKFRARFIGVTFLDSTINDVDRDFTECKFVASEIRTISLGRNGAAEFIRCDFSNTINTGSVVANVTFKDCYFEKASAPNFPPEWLEKITALA